jgi:hypothetical protein
MPRPIPRELPVTSACFPFSFITTSCSTSIRCLWNQQATVTRWFSSSSRRIFQNSGNLKRLLGRSAARCGARWFYSRWKASILEFSVVRRNLNPLTGNKRTIYPIEIREQCLEGEVKFSSKSFEVSMEARTQQRYSFASFVLNAIEKTRWRDGAVSATIR